MIKITDPTHTRQSLSHSYPASNAAAISTVIKRQMLLGIALLCSISTLLSAAEPYYIAHRGEYMTMKDGKGVVDAPEGTQPTYERVRDRNINAVKLDLQYTSDKVVVLSHDSNLKRMTGKDIKISNTKYEDIKKVPFLKVGDFENQHVPTLDETLKIVKDTPMFFVDFKHHTPEMMDKAFAIFKANGIPLNRIILASFNKKGLADAYKRYPDIPRILHVSYTKEKDGTFLLNFKTKCANFDAVKTQLAKWKKEMGLNGYNLPAESPYTTPEFLNKLKADGCWLSLWYIHSKATALKVKNLDVDGYVTGMPTAVRKIMTDK